MATMTLTASSFESAVREHDMILIDFWAGWCGPCRMFAPIFADASDAHPDVVFAKVDTDAESGLSSGMGIRSIPTLMAFRDGILVYSQPGALSAQALEQVIARLRSLDMDDIRAQLAQRSPAATTP